MYNDSIKLESEDYCMYYERDECCGCATESYPCLGRGCPNRNIPTWVCDECGDEYDEPLEEINGKDYCPICAKKFDEVEDE